MILININFYKDISFKDINRYKLLYQLFLVSILIFYQMLIINMTEIMNTTEMEIEFWLSL